MRIMLRRNAGTERQVANRTMRVMLVINSKIDELRDSRTLRELQLKWFGVEMDAPKSGYLPPGAYLSGRP
jgi:hypothetical protein